MIKKIKLRNEFLSLLVILIITITGSLPWSSCQEERQQTMVIEESDIFGKPAIGEVIPSDFHISLERVSGGDAARLLYQIDIFADGHMELEVGYYEIMNTDLQLEMGQYIGILGLEKVQEIVDFINNNTQIFSRRSYYPEDADDLPVIDIECSMRGRSKSFYHGLLSERTAPEEVYILEYIIEEIAMSSEWEKSD